MASYCDLLFFFSSDMVRVFSSNESDAQEVVSCSELFNSCYLTHCYH
jgi:hypothetical protein